MNILELEKTFSDAAYSTILELQNKLADLQQKNEHLVSLLRENTITAITVNHLNISNEQLICETQIALIKEKAITRDLNMEETKKFETFCKVLAEIKRINPDDTMYKVKSMSSEELLKLAESDDGSIS